MEIFGDHRHSRQGTLLRACDTVEGRARIRGELARYAPLCRLRGLPVPASAARAEEELAMVQEPTGARG